MILGAVSRLKERSLRSLMLNSTKLRYPAMAAIISSEESTTALIHLIYGLFGQTSGKRELKESEYFMADLYLNPSKVSPFRIFTSYPLRSTRAILFLFGRQIMQSLIGVRGVSISNKTSSDIENYCKLRRKVVPNRKERIRSGIWAPQHKRKNLKRN